MNRTGIILALIAMPMLASAQLLDTTYQGEPLPRSIMFQNEKAATQLDNASWSFIGGVAIGSFGIIASELADPKGAKTIRAATFILAVPLFVQYAIEIRQASDELRLKNHIQGLR